MLKLLSWWPLLLLPLVTVAGTILAYQATASYVVRVGTPSDEAYVRNFHTRLLDGGRPYRWSDVYGYVLFPGLGSGRSFSVTVALDTARFAPVTVIINGETFFHEDVAPGWRQLTFEVTPRNPQAFASRDTVIELRSSDFRSEDAPTEPRGVKVGEVRIDQAAAGGPVAPPYSVLLLGAILPVLVYLLFIRGSRRVGRFLLFMVALLTAVVLVLGIASNRVFWAAALPHAAVALVSSLGILLLCDIRLDRLVPRIRKSDSSTLAVVISAAFLLRFSGMALPQAVIIDMPWHMRWLRTLLAGDWQSLYFPGGLSSVPREWGLNILIPKSPLFYMLIAPAGLLPLEFEPLVKWLICLLDVTLLVPVFLSARCIAGNVKAGLFAAFVYAFMPLAFRGFAYGILPTIFAQALAVLSVTLLIWSIGKPWHMKLWIGQTLLAALTILAFPTVAVFYSIVVLSVSVWLLIKTTPAGSRAYAAYGRNFLVVLASAWVVAYLGYYQLYVADVGRSVAAILEQPGGPGSTVRWAGGFGQLLVWTSDYLVTVLPAMLAVIAGWVFLKSRTSSSFPARVAVYSWLAIAPIFVLVNYRADMIGKHLFFVMPAVAVLAGSTIAAYARRGAPGRAFVGLAVTVCAWQAVVFWFERLVRAST